MSRGAPASLAIAGGGGGGILLKMSSKLLLSSSSPGISRSEGRKGQANKGGKPTLVNQSGGQLPASI